MYSTYRRSVLFITGKGTLISQWAASLFEVPSKHRGSNFIAAPHYVISVFTLPAVCYFKLANPYRLSAYAA